jgi:hypothetical protein
MPGEKLPFILTEKAGPFVAGRRVRSRDRARVLWLTSSAADHEVRAGTIRLDESDPTAWQHLEDLKRRRAQHRARTVSRRSSQVSISAYAVPDAVARIVAARARGDRAEERGVWSVMAQADWPAVAAGLEQHRRDRIGFAPGQGPGGGL